MANNFGLIENKTYRSDPLWLRIAAHPMDAPDAVRPFSKKLAAAQGWNSAFTARAITEYKRFVYLCFVCPHGASPPAVVDEVWHLHLTYTVDYWTRFCRQVLQRDLHHHPSQGGQGERSRHLDWYAETLSHYRRVFGEEPPGDIWPQPAAAAPQAAGIATGLSWKNLLMLISPLGLILFLYGQADPFRLSGPHFLVFYPALAVACFASILWYYRQTRQELKAGLPHLINRQDACELAFLSGGEKRLLLLMVTTWIREGVLVEQQESHDYWVARKKIAASRIPQAGLLTNLGPVSIQSLAGVASLVAAPYHERYAGWMRLFSWRSKAVLLPVATLLAVGVLRIAQGIDMHQPVRYLVQMVVLSAALLLATFRACSFHRACTRLLRKDTDHYLADVDDDLPRTVILSGFAALAMLPEYRHLATYFTPAGSSGADGSGDSGGGDGGGDGGCGGGCGGCGGGD